MLCSKGGRILSILSARVTRLFSVPHLPVHNTPGSPRFSNVLDVLNQPFHVTGLAIHFLFPGQNSFLHIAVKPAAHYGGEPNTKSGH